MENIAEMRDRLIHSYFGVDYELVWETVKINLPELYDILQRILRDINS
ncbi:MAG: HepT-like ribonuclease domain-containing protein [Candidatus Heimdallarchaeaceae archaeon]